MPLALIVFKKNDPKVNVKVKNNSPFVSKS